MLASPFQRPARERWTGNRYEKSWRNDQLGAQRTYFTSRVNVEVKVVSPGALVWRKAHLQWLRFFLLLPALISCSMTRWAWRGGRK